MSVLERIKISLISELGYWIILFFGHTLRWEMDRSRSLESVRPAGKSVIMAFWHGRIFMATYYFRNRGITVITSQNRDGEYIARVIERFGYRAARGSSSRGSRAATIECLRAMESGGDVGLTIDGPRGPRYVAKAGAAFFARKSGNPVVPFHISAKDKWVMKSWDHFQIPKPFSRAVLLIGEPIFVEENATKQQIQEAEGQIQRSLDGLRERGDRWWGKTKRVVFGPVNK
jgi:lysophospholipid acyltransferase (LPLAT)-like uncharacterized protein